MDQANQQINSLYFCLYKCEDKKRDWKMVKQMLASWKYDYEEDLNYSYMIQIYIIYFYSDLKMQIYTAINICCTTNISKK